MNLRLICVPPLQNERQASSDRNKWPDKTWFDVNQVDIRQKEYESASKEYPGGYAAMKRSIFSPISKTANSRSEQDCGRR